MRKIILFAVLIAVTLTISSCSKEKTIVGSWKVTSVTSTDFDREEFSGEQIWTFYDTEKYNISYKYNDSISGQMKREIYKGTWRIYGDELELNYSTVVSDGEEYSVHFNENINILTLNSKEMTLCDQWGDIYEFKKI